MDLAWIWYGIWYGIWYSQALVAKCKGAGGDWHGWIAKYFLTKDHLAVLLCLTVSLMMLLLCLGLGLGLEMGLFLVFCERVFSCFLKSRKTRGYSSVL